ncbi:MAG: signal peptidase II [Lachnospiraceae bacterium]|nr:signal peptidase II [Lachnospiraceae bacterium]
MEKKLTKEQILKSKKILFLSIFLIVLLVFLDSYTKFMAISHLMDKDNIILIPGVLELSFVKNTGAAFSFMGTHAGVFRIIMGILTPIFLLAIIYLMVKIPKNKKMAPVYVIMIFVLSGAIGNYIDRMAKGFVVDFIYFSLIDFPVFNVADIYITCSFFILILLILFCYKDEDFKWLTLKK